MVKFCDKCGAELNNDNARFCDKCGAEVKTSSNQNSNQTTTVSGVVICPHCGQTTAMGLTHCEKCGSSLENNNTAVIAGYIVTFIVPIIGLIPAIYLLTRENGKAKTQGVFLIVWIVIGIIFNLLFGWVIYLIISIILMAVGIYLWYDNFSLFD